MTPIEFYDEILDPGLNYLAEFTGAPKRSYYADVMLLTISQQESGLKHRAQIIADGKVGPARGWWQFERGGGVIGVLTHSQTKDLAGRICESCHVPREAPAVWRCLEGHDRLAVAFARLLLWTDPAPLPETAMDGWEAYLRCWRPGKAKPASWPGYWSRATETLAHGAS